MITILNEQQSNDDDNAVIVPYLASDKVPAEQSFASAIIHHQPTTQLLLSHKPGMHIPEVGLNPLADAAAYLFSMMGRLIYLKSHTHLDKLYTELVKEIKNFQKTIEIYADNREYITEYAPITCYALCATLDDIISSTPWGGQGKWEKFSLVKTFIPQPPSQISFFIILERLIRGPHIYIDAIEFMYLCLTFGFKRRNDAGLSEFDHQQLEQITHSLYKRIRAYRGNFSKILSPISIKQSRSAPASFTKKVPIWLYGVCALSVALLLWTGSAYFVEQVLQQDNQTISQR